MHKPHLFQHCLSILTCLLLLAGTPLAFADAPANWGTETPIWRDGTPRYHSVDDSGSIVVALLPYSGVYDDPTTRDVAVIEKVGDTWGDPTVIANNGNFSHDTFQWLPQMTHPVISGDGQTIVYVGYNAANQPDPTNSAYMVTRLPGGGWSPPAVIDTNIPNTHYWISLSQDGHTLALSNYVVFGTPHVYILRRSGDTWSAPLQVSSDEPLIDGGHTPHLSADGNQLVFIQNARLMFSEFVNGNWTPPVQLTDNDWSEYRVETPQMSADGESIFYWYERVEPTESGFRRVEMHLYVMRRSGAGWGAPQRVTTEPPTPLDHVEAPPTANREATRFIYRRPIGDWEQFGDDLIFVYHSAHLEMAEWREGAWHITQILQASEYSDMNARPWLTPNGQTLIFRGGARRDPVSDILITGGLWQMLTEETPPPLNAPIITSEDKTTFTAGQSGTFTVAAIGDPTPGISLGGTAPDWVSLTDHGDGTATLAGTPPNSSGGIYPLSLVAANGVPPDAVQSFELVVQTIQAIGPDGGDITSNAGAIAVNVQPGAVGDGTTFTLIPQSKPTQGTGTLAFAGTSFQLRAEDAEGDPVTAFDPPLVVTIKYDPAALGGVPEESLMLYYWNTEGQAWNDAACGDYDRSLPNQFTVEICHLSEFAVLGETGSFDMFLPLIMN